MTAVVLMAQEERMNHRVPRGARHLLPPSAGARGGLSDALCKSEGAPDLPVHPSAQGRIQGEAAFEDDTLAGGSFLSQRPHQLSHSFPAAPQLTREAPTGKPRMHRIAPCTSFQEGQVTLTPGAPISPEALVHRPQPQAQPQHQNQKQHESHGYTKGTPEPYFPMASLLQALPVDGQTGGPGSLAVRPELDRAHFTGALPGQGQDDVTELLRPEDAASATSAPADVSITSAGTPSKKGPPLPLRRSAWGTEEGPSSDILGAMSRMDGPMAHPEEMRRLPRVRRLRRPPEQPCKSTPPGTLSFTAGEPGAGYTAGEPGVGYTAGEPGVGYEQLRMSCFDLYPSADKDCLAPATGMPEAPHTVTMVPLDAAHSSAWLASFGAPAGGPLLGPTEGAEWQRQRWAEEPEVVPAPAASGAGCGRAGSETDLLRFAVHNSRRAKLAPTAFSLGAEGVLEPVEDEDDPTASLAYAPVHVLEADDEGDSLGHTAGVPGAVPGAIAQQRQPPRRYARRRSPSDVLDREGSWEKGFQSPLSSRGTGASANSSTAAGKGGSNRHHRRGSETDMRTGNGRSGQAEVGLADNEGGIGGFQFTGPAQFVALLHPKDLDSFAASENLDGCQAPRGKGKRPPTLSPSPPHTQGSFPASPREASLISSSSPCLLSSPLTPSSPSREGQRKPPLSSLRVPRPRALHSGGSHSQDFDQLVDQFYGSLQSPDAATRRMRRAARFASGGVGIGSEAKPSSKDAAGRAPGGGHTGGALGVPLSPPPAPSAPGAPPRLRAAKAGSSGAHPQFRQVVRGVSMPARDLSDHILGRPYDDIRKYYVLHKQELGSGQFGVVRKCKSIGSGKVYACKSICKAGVRSEAEARDIRREVACLAMLQKHPGFVCMQRAIEDEKEVHIVMELCRGGDLLDYILNNGPLSEEQAAKLCCSLIESLLHCHCLGIVHCDVKPENILLTGSTPEGPMKLVDFGVASFFEHGVPLMEMAGTEEYMAPEVLGCAYGPEADIWSAGVVLYAALSGIPPFWASSKQTLAESILSKDVSFKSAKWAGKSEPCKDLIRRMLIKDPSKRIQATEILSHPWVLQHSS